MLTVAIPWDEQAHAHEGDPGENLEPIAMLFPSFFFLTLFFKMYLFFN